MLLQGPVVGHAKLTGGYLQLFPGSAIDFKFIDLRDTVLQMTGGYYALAVEEAYSSPFLIEAVVAPLSLLAPGSQATPLLSITHPSFDWQLEALDGGTAGVLRTEFSDGVAYQSFEFKLQDLTLFRATHKCTVSSGVYCPFGNCRLVHETNTSIGLQPTSGPVHFYTLPAPLVIANTSVSEVIALQSVIVDPVNVGH
jgi:hypothetical protein